MDRLKELEIISEQLEGTTIFKKNVWLIMDKAHNCIIKGTTSNRCLVLLNDSKDRKKVLTYNSAGSAENAIKNGWSMYEKGVSEYIDNIYGSTTEIKKCLEPVKAIISVKI